MKNSILRTFIIFGIFLGYFGLRDLPNFAWLSNGLALFYIYSLILYQ